MTGKKEGFCFNCNHALSELDYGRSSYCPSCNKATHVCLNCRFYKKGISNDCAEPIADHVAEKDRANFCGYFEPKTEPHEKAESDAEAMRKAAEDLFNF